MSQISQCPASTSQKKRCKNSLKHGQTLCHVHQKSMVFKNPVKYDSFDQCLAQTRDSRQCRNKSISGSHYCRVHEIPEEKNIGALIPDLEEIVSGYVDLEDYAKLIKYNSTKYSWEKYFKGELPSIVDAINKYDNLDLVMYLSPRYKDRFNYSHVRFKSKELARFILKEYPPNRDEYNLLVGNAIGDNNPKVLRMLLNPEIRDPMTFPFNYFLTLAMVNDNLEIIKILLNYGINNLDQESFDLVFMIFKGEVDNDGPERIKTYINSLDKELKGK